jgi:glycosyltransferase involved in cell wall biosynthesis
MAHMPIRLLWVSPVSASKLDSATWLDTTRELRKLGVDVTLVAAGPPGRHVYRGIEVLNFARPHIYVLGQALFHLDILRYLLPRREAYDVVLFHQISAIWLLPLRFLGRRRPLLLMDSRDRMDFAQGNLRMRLRNWWFHLVYWLSTRLLDGQTSITPRMAKLAGIPSQQLWGIWPSGVDPEAFAIAQQKRSWPAPSETGEADEAIHIVYIGIFLERRNLLPLCRAVKRANNEGMNFVFSLYGNGPLQVELKAFAAQTGGAVCVHQPVTYEQVPEILAQAHVGVTSLPDPADRKYEASSPIKMFEYIAAGLPLLATSNKCHTDVVGNGRYTFWITRISEDAFLDALRRIWQARDELPALGQEAMAAVQAWTWAAAAKKLHAALVYGTLRASQPGYSRETGQPQQTG